MSEPRPGEADLVLARFERLVRAVIDTSSLIQAEKAGFLTLLAAAIELVSVEDVRREYAAGQGMADLPPRISFVTDSGGITTDQKVLDTAVKLGLPIISEDRKILLRADQSRLDYYNALMMLEFLLFREAVDLHEYEECRGRLFENGRYSPWVKSYAERIHWEIRKRL